MRVIISWRPGGSSSMVETSRSPYSVSCSVRGIGVADIIRAWGCSAPRPRSAVRCSTPKRCCSSAIASARLGSSTPSWMSACVPTSRSRCPSAAIRSASRRGLARVLPVSRPTAKGRGRLGRYADSRLSCAQGWANPLSSCPTVRKCCSASTSVGAISADCRCAEAAASTAARATRVLPLPTSPCSRRLMGGVPRAISPVISPMQRRCAPVGVNGILPRKPSTAAG